MPRRRWRVVCCASFLLLVGKPVMYSKPMEDRIMEVRSTPLHSLFEEANKELWEREKME